MNPAVVADSILLIAPGFVFWKAAYFSGAQHQRLEWEWVVWSVLLSLPIAAVSSVVLAIAALSALPQPGPLAHTLAPFVLAIVLGLFAGRVWSEIKRSHRPFAKRWERQIRDSAWDLVLDEASERGPDGNPLYGVQVTIEVSGQHQSYYGAVDAFGYEGAGAERWLYLRSVRRWWIDEGLPQGGIYRPMDQTRGMLVHADKILRLRVIERVAP